MASKKFLLGVVRTSCRIKPRICSQVQHQHSGILFVRLCSSTPAATAIHGEVDVVYKNGLPIVSLPLPSRREKCQFTLKPLSNTLGDFYSYLQQEDGGIDRVSVYRTDGSRVAKSTSVENLMEDDFTLVINDTSYAVSPPQTAAIAHEHLKDVSDLKNAIAKLHSSLNIEQYQLEKENDFQQRIENIKLELQPLEEMKKNMELNSAGHTSRLTWLGLGMMGFQFGLFARLTWWEYSWDIMEPVTYFATYGTSMAMFAYYVLTKQEYNFQEARDREFILSFYRRAKKSKFDTEKYNNLKDALAQAENDLARLRDPLQLHLPIKEITAKNLTNQQ